MGLKIGLTGGIGSGKTTVAKIFSVLGVPIFYADEVARSVMTEDPVLKMKIKEMFGEEVYHEEKLNRKYLAGIVFRDPVMLDQLNAMVHPVTIARAETWMAAQTAPYVIKEAALFFESGSTEGLDYIVGVYAPQSLRINRVMLRDGLSREHVLERMEKQIDEEMKMKLCDFVVVNNEQTLVIPQVLELHAKFTQMRK